jgi:hypothetical protein
MFALLVGLFGMKLFSGFVSEEVVILVLAFGFLLAPSNTFQALFVYFERLKRLSYLLI